MSLQLVSWISIAYFLQNEALGDDGSHLKDDSDTLIGSWKEYL